MVKHVREMIHRVGSFDRFRKIVKKAIATESSGKGLKNLKSINGSQDNRVGDQMTAASQMVVPSSQPDSIIALQNMMRRVRDDVEKNMLGKDAETNFFKAVSNSKEQIGGAIA